jgi:hypothetical protein
MKLFTSHKASSTAVNLPFAIIVAIIVAAVLIFGVIPMATKPLGTDPCLQQNGVRAQYCEDDISARNNFIEPDDKNNICCMAIPGKQEEFKLWSRTLADVDRPGEASTGVVHASNAAQLYDTPSGRIAIYLETSEDARKKLAEESSANEAVVTNPTGVPFLEPRSNFVIAGVNNLANGECTFAIYEASVFLDSANPTYRPKQTADGRLAPPQYGFNYERKDCKQGNGVQITGQLQGRPYASPYYIAVYSLQTEPGKPAIRASALLNVSLPKPAEDDTTGSGAGSGNNLPALPSCTTQPCGTWSDDDEDCVSHPATFPDDISDTRKICPGCHWTKTSTWQKECVTCVIDSCDDYTTRISCERDPCYAEYPPDSRCAWHKGSCKSCDTDLTCTDFTTEASCTTANPCGSGCSWTGKNCLDCEDVASCDDYPDKSSCQNDECGKELDCNWKSGWFITNVCEDATSDDESESDALDTLNELEGETETEN